MLQVADITPVNAFTLPDGDNPTTTHVSATYVSELVDAQTWDKALGAFQDVSYEQSDSYMSGQWGDRVSRLLVRQANGRVLGGALVVEIKAPLLGTGLAYVKFGPFWQRREEPANEQVYRTVVTALREEFCTKRGHMLSVLPRPSPDVQEEEARVLREFGFAQRRPFVDPDRYLVRIHNDEETQLKSLAQKWRYNLKKSIKNNITVTHSDDNNGLHIFKALHEEMVVRKNFNDVDAVDLVPEMRAKLPDGLKPQIFIAHHNNEPVAGAVVGVMGDTAYYVYGASAKAALPRKAGFALQWEILRWLQNSKAQWYDLGGTVAEPGLHQFKKGLVGKSGRIWAMTGELDYWPNTRARLIGDTLYFTRALMQKLRNLR
ncbi:MAG: lipid II:glycine glycyltransferase FemX [Hyphomicrobiaceae bacterium]